MVDVERARQTNPHAGRDGDSSAPPSAVLQVPEISQEKTVFFHGIGKVRITALEVPGHLPELVFANPATGDELLRKQVGTTNPDFFSDDAVTGRKLRFKAIRIKSSTKPLIIGTVCGNTASTFIWEDVAIGAVDGNLKEVMPERLVSDHLGGSYFGDLGGGRGFGAANWSFIWGKNEVHNDRHRFEIKIYRWNARISRFEWPGVKRTKRRFELEVSALSSLGFSLSQLGGARPECGYY